jgi:hypothetical protein
VAAAAPALGGGGEDTQLFSRGVVETSNDIYTPYSM